ncbi:aconitate hydratase B, partial [Aliarcobacter butzleri]|nr:aconitate hydratase B [Aliarcobacter butzleri]
MSLLENYKAHSQERLNEGGLPALPLTAAQTAELVELLKADKVVDAEYALDLFKNKINPGVDDAAYVKAAFLNDIVQGKVSCSVISKVEAIQILGTMMGGYNVPPLVEALKIADVADAAAEQLKNTILVYNSFNDVKELMDKGNAKAKEVIESWANAEWFTNKPALEEAITLTVYKIPGETNTDDLSPATVAFTRADIPLHATAMLQSRMEKPLEKMAELKAKGHPLAYVGDVVGTGSSRKSGINSVQWHMGRD